MKQNEIKNEIHNTSICHILCKIYFDNGHDPKPVPVNIFVSMSFAQLFNNIKRFVTYLLQHRIY